MMESLTRFVYEAMKRRDARITVPEPEFRPFRLPRREAAAQVRPIASARREPRTLEELGVPGPLARELETTLELMGHTRGDRVVGYAFVTADGARHPLRLATVPGRDATGLAA